MCKRDSLHHGFKNGSESACFSDLYRSGQTLVSEQVYTIGICLKIIKKNIPYGTNTYRTVYMLIPKIPTVRFYQKPIKTG